MVSCFQLFYIFEAWDRDFILDFADILMLSDYY